MTLLMASRHFQDLLQCTKVFQFYSHSFRYGRGQGVSVLCLLLRDTTLRSSEPDIQITVTVLTKVSYTPDKLLKVKEDLSIIAEKESDLHMQNKNKLGQ